MRHYAGNRWLFGMVFSLVVSLPFMFNGCSGPSSGGADLSSMVIAQVASVYVDPYLALANDSAEAEDRPTALADVMAELPKSDPSAPPEGAAALLPPPAFALEADRIAVTFNDAGASKQCAITIDGGRAALHC